ncbi:MAG: hypothetical protein Q8M17_02330, partial [Actinomycetota bacterium]|nr:hypothetical protein [Actinomycetota bacterium]
MSTDPNARANKLTEEQRKEIAKKASHSRKKLKGTSKNPYLRAAALRLACLPRFVTILRCSQKIFPYLSIIC